MTEEDSGNDWDKNRVYSDYREHTGNLVSRIPALRVPNIPSINLDFDVNRFFDKRFLAVLAVLIVAAGGYYFDVADMLVTTPEEKAVNIADQNSMVEAYRQENGALSSTVQTASDEVLTNLAQKGAISDTGEEIYVVDYTGPDSNGVTAYVDLDTEEVVETDNNLRIG